MIIFFQDNLVSGNTPALADDEAGGGNESAPALFLRGLFFVLKEFNLSAKVCVFSFTP